MMSSLVPPLTCQHGLAVGKHGTDLFKNSTFHALRSNVQCVLGLYSFLNTAGNCSYLHPRDPQQLQEAVRLRRNLVSCAHITWAGCLMRPAALPGCAHCSKQDRIHPGAGQVREGPQQALLEVEAPAWRAECRHGLTCAGCCACKRWICSVFTWGLLVCRAEERGDSTCSGQLRAFGLSLYPGHLQGFQLPPSLAPWAEETQEGNPRRKEAKEKRSQVLNVRGVLPKAAVLVPVPSFAQFTRCFVFSPIHSTLHLHWTEPVRPLADNDNSLSSLLVLVCSNFFSMVCHISKDLLRHMIWHGFLPSSATWVSLRRGWNFPAPGVGQGTQSPSTSPALHSLWKSQVVTGHMHRWWAPREACPLGTSCHHQLLSQQILMICHKAKSL